MVRYIALIMTLFIFGCKEEEKEPPFEWLTFYPTDDQQSAAFKIYSHTMKRYYHESIGEVLERNEKDYGVTMKGRWIFSGVIVEFSNTARSSSYYLSVDSNGFLQEQHDTIKSTFKKQTK